MLRPLRPDGNVDHDLADLHVVGNHKGQFGGFNVVNPRPGTVHQYGTRADVLSARQRGWWVADPERDGRPAYELMHQHMSDPGASAQSSGDTLYPGYVHLVTTEENFRRLMEEQHQRSRSQLHQNADFLDRVSAEEYESGRTENGYQATRFATRDHGTFLQQDGRTIESVSPRGILREED